MRSFAPGAAWMRRMPRPGPRAAWRAGVLVASLVACAIDPARLAAQAAADSVYLRAQRLVASGDGPGARALVDSVLAATPPGTAPFAEALYWRATLASTAAEAERDYRRLGVEYPLSPRAEEALYRLAQLELVRGDRAGAVRHLQRLLREHPGSGIAVRGSFELARAYFDGGDDPRGCGALALAREGVAAGDVELGNRIAYYAPRCAGVVAASPLTGGPPAVAGGAAPAAGERPAGAPPPASAGAPPAPAPSAARPNDRPDERPATGTPAPGRTFSVQVAAFTRADQAAALTDVLTQRGFEARVWGSAAPYRVRVGRVATREEAEALRERLRRARINGMVVEAEPGGEGR